MSEEGKYEFKAEIKKLLDILSKSLYQNSEIFLRELISNSVDALEKVHFISLQNKDIKDYDLEKKIEIYFNKETKTITVSDTGIGMTKDELVKNLGTIAGSGTEQFIKALKNGQDGDKKIDLDLIGQFGVGFYSVFMVADRVEVYSSSYLKNEPSYLWSSDGSGEFTVKAAEKATRGTDIVLYLKSDLDADFLNQYELEKIIKKYSNYVPYPIYVIEEKTEKEEEKKEDEEKKEGEEKKPEPPKPVNKIEPIWKKKGEIKPEDYKEFYNYISKRYDDYLDVINYPVDGTVQFNSILFIPSTQSREMFEQEADYGLTLYCKNVMIMQNCKEIVPQWLRFIKGVLESEDIPLNISRETIQSNRLIRKMSELLVTKIMKRLEEMAEKEPEKYDKFWNEFGIFIKEGILSDRKYKDQLMKLLRFRTTKSNDKFIGLEDYLKNKKEDQKEIYYLVGDNYQAMKFSPHLSQYKSKDLEVILFSEPIDNFLMMNIMDYTRKEKQGDSAEEKDVSYRFKPVDTTEEEEIEKEKEEDKKEEEKDKDKESKEKKDQEFPEPINSFIKGAKKMLGGRVMDVKGSKKLYDNICRLASPAMGMSSTMQRAMRYWSMQKLGQTFEIPRKILEFNVEHLVVKTLAEIYQKNPKDGRIRPIVNQLFENCLLAEGDLPEPALMVPRMNKIIEILMTGNIQDESDETIKKEEDEAKEAEKLKGEDLDLDDEPEESEESKEKEDISTDSQEKAETKSESNETKKE